GSYGAGPSIVWDRGWFRTLGDRPAKEQVARGKLEFELFGFKLRGRWVLARMSGKEREWLLLKKADAFADGDEPVETLPESVLSGLTVEELRDGPRKLDTLRSRLAASQAPQGEVAALDDRGRSSFQRLQARMNLTRPGDVERASLEVPVSAVFFDALALDGRDLRRLPLEERKACLQLLLPARGVVHFGDHVLA